MKYSEDHFQGREGFNLYYQTWLPETEAKAVLVIAHGVAEHCGRYMNLVNYLVPKGYAVYGFDYRGHGKSEGRKGFVEHFFYYLDDLQTFLSIVRRQNPDNKIFLFGHSMGATVGLAFLVQNQNDLAGVILSGAAIRIKPRVPAALIAIMRPLAILAPKLGLKKLDSSSLSHNREIVQSYDNDPLVFRGKLSARLTIELAWTMHNLERQVYRIKTAMLVMHGKADQLTCPEGSRIIFERAGSQDKTLKLYSGFYHEILNEPGSAEVLADVEYWLRKHI